MCLSVSLNMLNVSFWGCHSCECNLHPVCNRLWNAESKSACIRRQKHLSDDSNWASAGIFLRAWIGIEADPPQALLLLELWNGLELVPCKLVYFTVPVPFELNKCSSEFTCLRFCIVWSCPFQILAGLTFCWCSSPFVRMLCHSLFTQRESLVDRAWI